MLLNYEDGILRLVPGPVDVSINSEVFSPAIEQGEAFDGASDLVGYTETALKCGITVVAAVPGQLASSMGKLHPVSNLGGANSLESRIKADSRIKTVYHLGIHSGEVLDENDLLNTKKLDQNFEQAGTKACSLYVQGRSSAQSLGMPIELIPEITYRWVELYPDKPVVLDLESSVVGAVLEEIYSNRPEDSKHIKIHITNASTRESLSAVTEARDKGMNVTCEVAPHDLFVSSEDRQKMGIDSDQGLDSDTDFLWENMRHIDVIAGACAAYRSIDGTVSKASNHTAMMQLLFGAVEDGKLSLGQVVSRTCHNPRDIFNITAFGNTKVKFDLRERFGQSSEIEDEVAPEYGNNFFTELERSLGREFSLVGRLLLSRSGDSVVERNDNNRLVGSFKSSDANLLRMRA